jgi:ribosome-associated protein
MHAQLTIPDHEITLTAMRSQGSGGQNVNKVSSAIHLRFHIPSSSLAADIKHRLLSLKDHRITRDGHIIIKAQTHRSQEMNRGEALERLHDLINSVAHPPKYRTATQPTYSSKLRRLEGKRKHAERKSLRSKNFS